MAVQPLLPIVCVDADPDPVGALFVVLFRALARQLSAPGLNLLCMEGALF